MGLESFPYYPGFGMAILPISNAIGSVPASTSRSYSCGPSTMPFKKDQLGGAEAGDLVAPGAGSKAGTRKQSAGLPGDSSNPTNLNHSTTLVTKTLTKYLVGFAFTSSVGNTEVTGVYNNFILNTMSSQ